MYKIMTKLELLAAIRTMTVAEQLEVLEVTSKIIREGLKTKTDLAVAAEKMQAYYAAGSELTTFVDHNNENFYEYSEYA
jgi:hypothetical protein